MCYLNKSIRNKLKLIIERSNYNDYERNCDAVELLMKLVSGNLNMAFKTLFRFIQ